MAWEEGSGNWQRLETTLRTIQKWNSALTEHVYFSSINMVGFHSLCYMLLNPVFLTVTICFSSCQLNVQSFVMCWAIWFAAKHVRIELIKNITLYIHKLRPFLYFFLCLCTFCIIYPLWFVSTFKPDFRLFYFNYIFVPVYIVNQEHGFSAAKLSLLFFCKCSFNWLFESHYRPVSLCYGVKSVGSL